MGSIGSTAVTRPPMTDTFRQWYDRALENDKKYGGNGTEDDIVREALRNYVSEEVVPSTVSIKRGDKYTDYEVLDDQGIFTSITKRPTKDDPAIEFDVEVMIRPVKRKSSKPTSYTIHGRV